MKRNTYTSFGFSLWIFLFTSCGIVEQTQPVIITIDKNQEAMISITGNEIIIDYYDKDGSNRIVTTEMSSIQKNSFLDHNFNLRAVVGFFGSK